VQISGLAEAVQEVVAKYAQVTSGICPEVLPVTPPGGEDAAEMMREVKRYTILMSDVIEELERIGCTTINVPACKKAVEIFRMV